jgi:phage N-6-adenine-methyltransferase
VAINKALFSSAKSDWETPAVVFRMMNARHNFTLDACASAENAKVKTYFTKEHDALKQRWTGRVWMNPPYGRNIIGKWVAKAYLESQKCEIVCCLLPARTDTAWWHDFCMFGQIELIRGRLKFVGAETGAPFPSAIVTFGRNIRIRDLVGVVTALEIPK